MNELRRQFADRVLRYAPMLLGLLTGCVHAATETDSLNVAVKATIDIPPCIINGGAASDVDFGKELVTTRVNGSNYTTPIDYVLYCVGDTGSALRIQISGTGASFDPTVLQIPGQPNMAIEILNGTTKLPLNSWLNFTNGSPPVLQAVPVKKAGSQLTTGPFEASATLSVAYQ
ncbi:Pilin (type 1 fimbria component protein) [Izhakiella capsodis]|uniref:Pilin (Type 1 fimbria component protein) n=1 Tax=Izhakiella capsodis TaxID=1367852 RepID=A0A1I4ZYE5_9GAMM|nr:fimbrial protein [Izhakiella capsodis]SFN55244.1 Pilin (type 1 fimbria component protein) [Izhakiella capsodis]